MRLPSPSRILKSSPTRGAGRRAARPAPRLEALEDRVALAADLNFREFASVAGADAAGNVYVHGDTAHPADLDPGPGTTWMSGPYLAKYSAAGSLLWAESMSPHFGAGAFLMDPEVHSSGGQTFLTLCAGQTGSPFLARFEDTGAGLTEVWRTAIAPAGENLEVGPDGSVYLAGSFSDTLDFDPGDGPGPDDTFTSQLQDSFVARWSAAGAFQWVRHLGGSGNSWLRGLAVVNDGVADTVVVGGLFNGSFSPQGGSTLTDQGRVGQTLSQDGYVLRYDAAGAFVSAAQFSDTRVSQVAGGPGGTYLALTHYWEALGFPATQTDDLLLGQLNAAGDGLAWVKQVAAGPRSDGANDLLVDGGRLLLTGGFGNQVDFDPGPGVFNLTALGNEDGYVASYSAADGSFQWAERVGSDTPGNWTPVDYGNSLAVAGTALYVGASFPAGAGTYGPDTLVNYQDNDGAVMRMTTAGGHAGGWAFSVGSVVRTVDNGGPGYSEIGSGWKNNTAGGFAGDSRYHAKGNGGNKAQWAFSGLPAGQYEVLATWQAGSKNATNAVYTLNGTPTAPLSQRVAPADYRSDAYSSLWESLGTVTVGPGGALTVQLSDAANGNVVADAVRVFLTAPASPLLAAGGPGTRSAEGLGEPELRPLVAEALARWQAAGADTSALANVTVRIADLGGSYLGLASGDTVWIDDDAAGWGWFVDPTPHDDGEFLTAGDQGEQGRMDLLTALMHEMGHLLGRGHDEAGVMHETLAAGTREGAASNPASALDALFSQPSAAPVYAPPFWGDVLSLLSRKKD